MAKEDIFVGREGELKAFREVLERAEGEAVVVVGQMGMGKTWLVNRMARMAGEHPDLKCGCVRYEVTQTDNVDSTMALIMDNAFEAAQVQAGSLDATEQRAKQWKALLNIINIGDLVFSLKRDPAKNTREQFLERLRLISKRIPENGRAILIIDPEKYMQKESDQSWAILVKDLPGKIKMVFAQRAEGVLVDSETFGVLDNVVHIPEKGLDVLDEAAVDELLDRRAGGLDCSVTELREAMGRYEGHPYAIQAALDLVEAGTALVKLPADPTPARIARVQRKKVCSYGEEVIKVFEAYVILEVAVPDETVEAVSGTESLVVERVLEDSYLGPLLHEEAGGKRIYHAILADHFLEKIKSKREKRYQRKAIEVYRKRLKADVKPDALAAVRLPEHVLAADGEEAFVKIFVDECAQPLVNLGLFDEMINLSERALRVVHKGSPWEAALLGNLGPVYVSRGDVDRAEELVCQALGIAKRIGCLVNVASGYGNLGIIKIKRGELDKAEDNLLKALELNEKAGNAVGEARQYVSLGIVYGERGELEKAAEVLRKALEVSTAHEIAELIGTSYGNLGVIYRERGELDKAEEMQQKSLEIDERLGLVEGMANSYGSLGLICMDRGDLDKAEEMFRKSLEYDEKCGSFRRMGMSYKNLGLVYKKRGDLRRAREYWEKSRDLYERMGMTKDAEEVQGWIGGINEN